MTTRRSGTRGRSRDARGHWWLLGFALIVLVLMLLLQGISVHTIGASRTAPDNAPRGPSQLRPGASLLTAMDGHLAPLGGSPGRRVALTFDDGPSKWTDDIVAVLRRYHVPASFFVVGAQAVRHPGAVRAVHRQGFELGDHTYTHVAPASVPSWEAALQANLTQSVVAGITGVRPRLYRPPYSSFTRAVTARDADAYEALARRGYIVTLTDYDGEDWRRPGADEIVRNATPPGRRGGIILLHDGGGDRSETVAAVRRLIPELRRRGFQFVTVSQLAGIPLSAADAPASGAQRLRAHLLLGALRVAAVVTRLLTLAVLLIAVLTALRMLLVFALARRRRPPLAAGAEPPVSVVVPAYNEELNIGECVTSIAASDYADFEVVVVDDGSTDATAEVVESLAFRRVRLLRQANAGKAAALNRGIAAARHDAIVCVDADTVFEPGTLRALVRPFADPAVGAISGQTKVANRRRLIGRWQHIEYVMGFNLDRRMFEVLGCVFTVPGAIGAFRRQALSEVGGFSASTLAEDTDVAIAIGRAGWRVAYEPAARSWTEAPSTLGALWRQRYRWAYGTLQCLWKHRQAVRRPGQRRVGLRALPYLGVFHIVLPCLAPLIDLFALYGLLFLHPLPVLAYWLVFNVALLALAVYAFRLDHEPLHPLWALPVQQFVYRQLMYLVVFQSVVSAVRGVHLRWQRVHRTGEVAAPANELTISMAASAGGGPRLTPALAGGGRPPRPPPPAAPGSTGPGSGASTLARRARRRWPVALVLSALLVGAAVVTVYVTVGGSGTVSGRLLHAAAHSTGSFVRLNQVGYEAHAPKRALLMAQAPEDGAPFEVFDASSHHSVLKGRVAHSRRPWSKEFSRLYVLDFGALSTPGTYRVVVGGRAPALSPPFRIGPARQLYRPLVSGALTFFAAQRDGLHVDRRVLGRRPSHLADVNATVYRPPGSKRALEHGDLSPVGRNVDVSGGWFDAGDFTKFVETASFTDAMLLFSARGDPGAPSRLREESRFGTDWLGRMWDESSRTLYYQVGLGDGAEPHLLGDHDSWGPPETDDGRPVRKGSPTYFLKYRPVFRAGRPGSPLSPNLAGRLAAAFGLCAQVFRTSDPPYAQRCLLEGQTIFDAAKTRHVGKLQTTAPYDYYPEVEWRDDMELGAAELYLATDAWRSMSVGMPHRDPVYYLPRGARWANDYMSGPTADADSLNLYDVSALAHYELFHALQRAVAERQATAGDFATTPDELLGDMHDQLRKGVQHQADAFGLSNLYGATDTVPHALGYALTAELYDELTHGSTYESFAANERDWVLGANGWGSSFVVGAGSTYPHCLAHKVANLSGSLDGRPPLLRGATVDGPSDAAAFRHNGAPDGYRRCPADGRDRFARFDGPGARYEDDVTASASSEPSDDYTALALALFAHEQRRSGGSP